MPDGDRFERKLRGKGWRSVYRLGCSCAPIEAVVDKIVGAAAHAFRTESVDGIRSMYSALNQALNRHNESLFRDTPSDEEFEGLSHRIQSLVIEEGYSEMSRLGERAVLRTFNELEKSGGLSEEDVKQQFTRNLVFELAERRCLGAVREGVMEASGREQETQMNWESEMRRVALKPCASLSKGLLSQDDSRSIRAPRRLFKQKPVTIEMLNEALPMTGKGI